MIGRAVLTAATWMLALTSVSAEDAAIARNHEAAIDLCLDYVDAQQTFLRLDPDKDGVPAFAQRIRSRPGRRDGLFWPIAAGEDESPFGPNMAAAAATEVSPHQAPRPLSGYFIRILLAPNPAAGSGARDSRSALIAWPAHYGVSGVHSFVVNHLGEVYARDLGPDTARIAIQLSTFDPGSTWRKVISD